AGVSPVPAPGPKAVADLIDRLGGPDFADREAAEKSVEAVADTARVELRAAVAGAGPEVRRRLGAVLERTDPGHPLAGDRLRAVRAVEVLERVGSAEARRVLDGLAAGAPGARLTDEARAAVGRLGRQ
ncbi:MAG: hypothetical protein K2X87_06470, partial [Gemmataceae bacterium]|nr:hypothetical protein [Gemmataceae bacterium]